MAAIPSIGIPMPPAVRLSWILLAAALGACSSGGGGAPAGTAPTVVGATYVGTGAAPATGEIILLRLSTDVMLRAGAILDDADVSLSDGTLGTVATPPTLDSPRTVRIVLGTGVNLRPGQTTITFSKENDVVQSVGGVAAEPDLPRTIRRGDGDVPTISSLTLEKVDDELNGTGPAGGRLQVARSGFTIDVVATDRSSAIVPSQCDISASANLAVDGLRFAAGRNLAPELTATVSGDLISWAVPARVVFPTGEVTISVMVTDATGMTSSPLDFHFRTVDATDSLRPFEDGQLWFLDTSRDLESYTAGPDPNRPSVLEVAVVPGSNSRADLEDLMLITGLWHTMPLANVSAGRNSNGVVFAEFESQVLADLDRLFEGIDVAFTFDRPGSFPAGQTAVPYADFPFSQICIAGSATEDGLSGTLGAALLDLRNRNQEDDCTADFQGVRLGVFLHTAVRFGARSGGLSTWRSTFDPFMPARNGTPIGADLLDRDRLTGSLSDSRTNEIQLAIRSFARSAAVITAHECGHSMGLVANGAMPSGLFGGDATNFPLSAGLGPSSASGHIQNTSLFPPGSQNVMSPAIDFDSSLSPSTAFNSLNRAYLRERALYNQ